MRAACLALLLLALWAVPARADTAAYDTLVRSARLFETIRSVHLHREGATPMDIDYEAPDRYHLSYKGTEMIWIGATQYVRTDGPWSSRETQSLPPLDKKLIEDQIGSLQRTVIRAAGAAKLGNLETHKYTIKAPDGSLSTVWVGDADGYTYRIENFRPDQTFESAFIYSNFNQPVEIVTPVGAIPASPEPTLQPLKQ